MDLVLIIGLIIFGIFFMILEVYLIPRISVAFDADTNMRDSIAKPGNKNDSKL